MVDLAGVLIVCVEQALAAPMAMTPLADAGARVIEVERPEGDFARRYDDVVHGESVYCVWVNRGSGDKESICLDLRQDENLADMKSMICQAGIFVENLAPGAATRLGIGQGAMRMMNPWLMYISISEYGQDGPFEDQQAYDILEQCESGLMSVSGMPEGNARVGISVCDIAAEGNRVRRCSLGALRTRAERAWSGHRSIDVPYQGALGERPVSSRALRRQGAGAGRLAPSIHCALRRVPMRRRSSGAAPDSERTGMGDLLRRGTRYARLGARRAVFQKRPARHQRGGARGP